MSKLQKGDRVTVKVQERPEFNGVIVGEGRGGHWWIIVKDGAVARNAYAKSYCRPRKINDPGQPTGEPHGVE